MPLNSIVVVVVVVVVLVKREIDGSLRTNLNAPFVVEQIIVVILVSSSKIIINHHGIPTPTSLSHLIN